MTILFISYWGINEGITQATVIPHVRILSEFNKVQKIVLVTVEREARSYATDLPPMVTHVPLTGNTNYFLKVFDFIFLFYRLLKVVKNEGVNLILCRGVMAGAIGHFLNRKSKIPYCVESFEPHADYMKESGVWKAFGIRYQLQKYWERQQLKSAQFIMTVTDNYTRHLVENSIRTERLVTMPCAVSLDQFRFYEANRTRIRAQLGLDETAWVGIYCGKFGGIYYDREAFHIFRCAFEFFGSSFFLIVLSQDDQNRISARLDEAGISMDRVFLKTVPHARVEQYLSAADFAFSTIKPAPSRKYCSPIKDGEYWANGLPIVLTTGVGDDALIIGEEDGGVIYDLSKPETLTRAFGDLQKSLLSSTRSERFHKISQIAARHRSFEIVRNTYRIVLSNL